MKNVFVINNNKKKTHTYNTATVGNYSYSLGATLIFPGQSTASTKRYKVNKSISLSAGNRVQISKESGTYVVVCRI